MASDDRNTRIALFQKREIRHTLHHDEWWFVITDIIAALTDSPDPSGYWKKMRKRDPDLGKALKGGGNLSPLPWSFRRRAGRFQLSATPSGSTSFSRTNTGGGSANAPHTTG